MHSSILVDAARSDGILDINISGGRELAGQVGTAQTRRFMQQIVRDFEDAGHTVNGITGIRTTGAREAADAVEREVFIPRSRLGVPRGNESTLSTMRQSEITDEELALMFGPINMKLPSEL